MNTEINRYDDFEINSHYMRNFPPEENQMNASNNLVGDLLRRWKLILLIFILIGSVGIPAVWLFIPDQYQAIAQVQIKPVINSFLFSDAEMGESMPAYDSFRNTHAEYMTCPIVVTEVANLLAKSDLSIFRPAPKGLKNLLKEIWASKDITLLTKKNLDREEVLKALVRNGKIKAVPKRNSEMTMLVFEHTDPEEALTVVKAFSQAYMTKIVKPMEQKTQLLNNLQTEQDNVRRDVFDVESKIQTIASKHGSRDLQKLQEITLNRISDLQNQLAKMELEQLDLNNMISSLEKEEVLSDKEDIFKIEQENLQKLKLYVNSDPRIQSLTQNIIQAEERLIIAQQELSPENPELKRMEKLIETLNNKLDERKRVLEDEYEGVSLVLNKEGETPDQETLIKNQRKKILNDELVKLNENIELLSAEIQKQEEKYKSIGLDQLEMLDLKDKLTLTKTVYDRIQNKIQAIDIESDKRPGRIETPYEPSSVEMANKKMKLLAGVVFAALGAGVGFAFLLSKLDKSLRTPMDVTRRIGVPVIGTTISVDRVDRKLLPEYLNNDYQNIRANLNILSQGKNLKRLVVASAGPREGKTTLAINLAASLSQTGQKVLLIDGDFRKQGVKHTLRLPVELRGFYEVVMGDCAIEDAIYFYPNAGFSVMVGSCRMGFDPVDLLSRPQTIEILDIIARQYDHIIIDTPPVLVAPDAVLWGKLSDAVVLSSFAGTTAAPALKEVLDKFAAARVKVLGNVLGNVDSRSIYGYYGYGYGYGPDAARKRINAITDSSSLLIQHDTGEMS